MGVYFTVKNLPLLLSMLIVGNSSLTISKATQLLHWFLIIIAVVFNICSAIGLILHVGVQKPNKN